MYFDRGNGRLYLRIVYAGPPLSGKTESLKSLLPRLQGRPAARVASPSEARGRTLYFDWAEYQGGLFHECNIVCQLTTVPGQASLQARRRLLVEDADSVIFVVDSQADQIESNRRSLAELAPWLDRASLPPVPVIYQCGKRDLPKVASLDDLRRGLRLTDKAELYPTNAVDGEGLRLCFVAAVRAGVRRGELLLSQGAIPLGKPEVTTSEEMFARIGIVEGAAGGQADDAGRAPPDEPGRRASEDAARRASEDAARRASEDAARRASGEAARRASGEAARRASEEAARRATEDLAREEAARQEKEDAGRRAEESAWRVNEQALAQQEDSAAAARASEADARYAAEVAEESAREERQRLEDVAEQEKLEAARRVKALSSIWARPEPVARPTPPAAPDAPRTRPAVMPMADWLQQQAAEAAAGRAPANVIPKTGAKLFAQAAPLESAPAAASAASAPPPARVEAAPAAPAKLRLVRPAVIPIADWYASEEGIAYKASLGGAAKAAPAQPAPAHPAPAAPAPAPAAPPASAAPPPPSKPPAARPAVSLSPALKTSVPPPSSVGKGPALKVAPAPSAPKAAAARSAPPPAPAAAPRAEAAGKSASTPPPAPPALHAVAQVDPAEIGAPWLAGGSSRLLEAWPDEMWRTVLWAAGPDTQPPTQVDGVLQGRLGEGWSARSWTLHRSREAARAEFGRLVDWLVRLDQAASSNRCIALSGSDAQGWCAWQLLQAQPTLESAMQGALEGAHEPKAAMRILADSAAAFLAAFEVLSKRVPLVPIALRTLAAHEGTAVYADFIPRQPAPSVTRSGMAALESELRSLLFVQKPATFDVRGSLRELDALAETRPEQCETLELLQSLLIGA